MFSPGRVLTHSSAIFATRLKAALARLSFLSVSGQALFTWPFSSRWQILLSRTSRWRDVRLCTVELAVDDDRAWWGGAYPLR